MAEELKDSLGLEVRLIEGSKGIFEVRTAGRLVFSKKEVGRFPEAGEISGLLSGKS